MCVTLQKHVSTLIYGGALLRMTLLDAFLTLITSFKFPSPTDANSIFSVRTVKCCKRKIWNNISIFRTSPFNDKSINQSLFNLFYGCVESFQCNENHFPFGPAILIAGGGGAFTIKADSPLYIFFFSGLLIID